MVSKRILFHLIVCVLAAAVWASCASEHRRIPIDDVRLPGDHQVIHWMEVLHDLPGGQNRAKALAHMTEAHPEFWPLWCEDILQLGDAQDSTTVDVLRQFLIEMHPMLDAIDSTSGRPEVLRRETDALLDGLKRHQVLFPDAPVPDIIMMPSGFNFAVFPTPSCLGLGLDWYMGPEHPLLQELPTSQFPQYRLNRMKPEWMASDAMKGWLLVTQQHRIPPGARTADLMLFWGQILHLTSLCMPDATPAQLMNWTPEQWAWAEANERAIWAQVQPQERMFNNRPRDVMRWFQEGPFTRVGDIPQDSPDRLGAYLGWKMVQAQTAERGDLPARGWFEARDPQPFLRTYRP
jgi:hypothetical protein